MLFRSKRRASFSLDEGRPRFNLGLNLARRSRSGHRFQDAFGQFFDDMERTNLMRYLPKDLADRFGRQLRTIRRDPFEGPSSFIQSCLETTKKRVEVGVARIVVEHRRQHPLVLPIVHRRQHAVRPLIEFINRGIARKRLKGPLQKRATDMPLCLFFPQPPPNFGSWQRGQTRGDRARGANWPGGRASYLRPPPAPPGQSRGSCNGYRVERGRIDRCCNTSCNASNDETSRSPGGRLGDQCINRQGRARCAARRCGERRDDHIVGRGFAYGHGYKSPVEVLGGP